MNCVPHAVVLVVYGMAYCSASNIEFNTTQQVYNAGDNVTLTCYLKSGWLLVTFKIKLDDVCYCMSPFDRCIPIDKEPGPYNYVINDSEYPTMIINNVTEDESGVNFTCQWINYADTVSFYVQGQGRAGGQSWPVGLAVGLLLACSVIVAALVLYIYRKRTLARNNVTDSNGNGTRQMDNDKEEVTTRIESDPLISIENNLLPTNVDNVELSLRGNIAG